MNIFFDEAQVVSEEILKKMEQAAVYAAELEDECERYRDAPLPAIISIPGQSGNTGYGMAAIRNAVERAVGADIIFKN